MFGSVFLLGPAAETYFMPVYSKFKINTIVPTPEGGSEITFQFTKYRNCKPTGTNWFIGEPGGAFRQIDMVSDPPDKQPFDRPIGHHISQPYKVDVSPSVFLGQSFAVIFSDCHPFWFTRSSIYP
jgi:hypothetical protein